MWFELLNRALHFQFDIGNLSYKQPEHPLPRQELNAKPNAPSTGLFKDHECSSETPSGLQMAIFSLGLSYEGLVGRV